MQPNRFDRDFPLDDAAVNALFAEMGARMMAIYEAEVTALGMLKSIQG